MTRAVHLVGFAVLAAAVAVTQAAAVLTHRVPTLGATLAALLRWRAGQVVVAAFWLWLGWHLFVRRGVG